MCIDGARIDIWVPPPNTFEDVRPRQDPTYVSKQKYDQLVYLLCHIDPSSIAFNFVITQVYCKRFVFDFVLRFVNCGGTALILATSSRCFAGFTI